ETAVATLAITAPVCVASPTLAQIGAHGSTYLTTSRREHRVLEAGQVVQSWTIYAKQNDTVQVSVDSHEPLFVECRRSDGTLLGSGQLAASSGSEITRMLMPVPTSAFVWHGVFETTAADVITVEIRHDATPTDTLAFCAWDTLKTQVGAAMVASTDERLGNVVGLAMIVMDGVTPCSGTVEATLKLPDETFDTVWLHDDGVDADATANDGVFSGAYETLQSGEHVVVGEFNGTDATGFPVTSLRAAASFDSITNPPNLPDPPIVAAPLPWSVEFEVSDINNNDAPEQIFLRIDTHVIDDTRGTNYTLTSTVTPYGPDGVALTASVAVSASATGLPGQFLAEIELDMAVLNGLSDTARLVLGDVVATAGSASRIVVAQGIESDPINLNGFEHCPA
ncbi:MAG: choice-of-anchor X domain-containing protein, partial [Planctomycetota bacterium]